MASNTSQQHRVKRADNNTKNKRNQHRHLAENGLLNLCQTREIFQRTLCIFDCFAGKKLKSILLRINLRFSYF